MDFWWWTRTVSRTSGGSERNSAGTSPTTTVGYSTRSRHSSRRPWSSKDSPAAFSPSSMRAARSSGSRITNRSRSARSRSANERTSTGRPPEPFGRKRWPRVARPLSHDDRALRPALDRVDGERHDGPVEQEDEPADRPAERERAAAVVEPRVPAHALREERGRAGRRRGARAAPRRWGARPPSSRRAGRARPASPGPWRPRPGPRPRPRSSSRSPARRPSTSPRASFATLSDGPQTGSSRSGWRAGTSARSTRRRGV